MADNEDDLDVLDSTEEDQPVDDDTLEDEDDADDLEDGGEDDDTADADDEDKGEDADDSEDEPDADEIVITVEGEEADPEENTPIIRKLRKIDREKTARIKELEAQVAEKQHPASSDPGPQPKLDDFDFDEAKFAAALTDWHDKKRKADDAREEARRQEQADLEAWQSRLNDYEAEKRKFGAKDYDEAEALVRDVLPPDRQGMILDAVSDPPKVIYALGKRPDILERLGKITNPVVYVRELVRLEGRLKVKSPTPKPKPERRVKGGSQAAASADRKLERLRAEAQKTGDYSKVTAYRRKAKV